MYGNIQFWIDPTRTGCVLDKEEVQRRIQAYEDCLREKGVNMTYAAEKKYTKLSKAYREIYEGTTLADAGFKFVDRKNPRDGEFTLTRGGLFRVQVAFEIDISKGELSIVRYEWAKDVEHVKMRCCFNTDPGVSKIPCSLFHPPGTNGVLITRSPQEHQPHRMRIEMCTRNVYDMNRVFFEIMRGETLPEKSWVI
jgi:hypothetical protein